jgi:hypothetical protein
LIDNKKTPRKEYDPNDKAIIRLQEWMGGMSPETNNKSTMVSTDNTGDKR